jgi:hypothetical protein
MTTCPFKLKFIIVDYLQSYKTLQLFENIFTFNTNKFTTINVKKTHMYRHRGIKNAKIIKAWIKLKLNIVLGLMK